jgi:N-acylglucosamine-6-phosphate 2-epimerase
MVDSMSKDVVTHLERGLIVSCQAPEGSPLGEPKILAQIALAAEDAGAIAIRAQGLANIEAIKGAVSVPVIGLIKRWTDSPVYITPAITDVQDLAAVGADIIALDATDRLREGGQNAFEFVVEAVHAAGDIPIMADIDDLASALTAEKAGALMVGTTLSGYTGEQVPEGPDVALVAQLKGALRIPIIAEGRYSTAADVLQAFSAGAHAVCMGTAITDPWTLTKKLVSALR